MWAPMVDEQIRIDEEEGKYKYPGIDAPLESEENDDDDNWSWSEGAIMRRTTTMTIEVKASEQACTSTR